MAPVLPATGPFLCAISSEPAPCLDIVSSQTIGGGHVSLAKTKSTGVAVQRSAIGLGDCLLGYRWHLDFAVGPSARLATNRYAQSDAARDHMSSRGKLDRRHVPSPIMVGKAAIGGRLSGSIRSLATNLFKHLLIELGLRYPLGTLRMSHTYIACAVDHGVVCSMSRSGNVWDNAAMESFFSSLKTERTARRMYRTRDDAKADVFDYIERFYNPKRRHSTIGYLSPMEFERQAGLA